MSARADVYSDIGTNSSYLVNTKYIGLTSNLIILEHNRELALAQQYDDMMRSYEYKMSAGTMSMADQINYTNAGSSFGQNIFNEVKNYQQSSQTNKLVAAIHKNEDLVYAEKVAKYPAIVVGGTLGLYNGTSYTILKTEHFSLTPGESIKNKSASLAISSVAFNASVAANTQSIITNINRGLINHVSVNYTGTTPVQPGTPTHTVSFNYGIPL
jgi:hypothetical protein